MRQFRTEWTHARRATATAAPRRSDRRNWRRTVGGTAANGITNTSVTTQDGKSTGSLTTYETISGEVYRVVTGIRMTGTTTNDVSIQKTQLTGLSDALRSRTIATSRGRTTIVESSFDEGTGLLTKTTRTDGRTPEVEVSRHGVVLERTMRDGRSKTLYDAFGRRVSVVVASPSTGATNRIDRMEYDLSGNVVRTVSDLMDGRIVESTAEYDTLGRGVAETDALGHVKTTDYDALDRMVFTGSDAYLLRFGYDTAGRKTSMRTTRDGGETGTRRSGNSTLRAA